MRALALFVAVLSAALPVRGSCQTEYCHQHSRLHHRQSEREARQAAEEDPEDPEKIRTLLSRLRGRATREREIEAYEARYTWRRPPHRDYEAEEVAERRYWTRLLALAEPDDPDVWCRHDRELYEPDERLERLRQRLSRLPETLESGEVAPAYSSLLRCLARELAGQGRSGEARTLLRQHLDRVLDPDAFPLLIHLQDSVAPDERAAADAAVRSLREEEATRRPGHLPTQIDLLRHYLRSEDPEQVEEGVVLARDLLSRPLTDRAYQEVCWAIPHEQEELRWRCWHDLLRAPFEGDPEEQSWVRRSARESLIAMASRDRDWTRLEPLLVELPLERRLQYWLSAVDGKQGRFCSQFVDAFEKGLPWEEGQASWLAHELKECGRPDLERRVLAEAGFLDGRGRDVRDVLTLEDLDDLHPSEDAVFFPRRGTPEAVAKQADDALIGQLEERVGTHPWDLGAWLYLAAIAEYRAQDSSSRGAANEHRLWADRAVEALASAADRRPDDLDVPVVLGAAALRLDRPDRVRDAARRLQVRHANPRQQAEAEYLLGRLARREGRWEEAADRLTRYFLLRLRFCREGDWEIPFLIHLVETGDPGRLEFYLEKREEALADYRLHNPPSPPPEHPLLLRQWQHRQVFAEPDGDLLGLECISPRALEHLEHRLADDPADGELRQRLARVAENRLCTPEELPDPEPLFPDDRLLALSGWMRAVD